MLDRNEVQKIRNSLEALVLSLYLRVDPGYQQNQSQNPAWRIWLKTELRNAEEKFGEERAEAWSAIKQRVQQWLDNYNPRGKTLVLFSDENDLIYYELPITLDNHMAVGAADLTSLLWAVDEYERYLIVLVDQEQAKFTTAYLGSTTSQSEMSIDLDYDWGQKTLMPASSGTGHALNSGNNRERFEDMIDAHVDRFHQDVADYIQTLTDELGASRLIIGGAERAAHNVRNKLHETMEKQVVDVLPIPVETNENDLIAHVAKAGLKYERDFEKNLVEEVIGFAKAQGRGAIGEEAVKQAFTMQQVETLILSYPPEDPDLTASLTWEALEQNSQIELVHGDPANALREEGGIAARLYYTVSEQ